MNNLIKLFVFLLSAITYAQNYKLEYATIDNGSSRIRSNIITYYVKPNEKMAIQMVDMKNAKRADDFDERLKREGKRMIDYDTFPVFWVLIDYKNNISYVRANVGKKRVIEKDQRPIIKWTITNETKEIAGFECTKATGYYRGRNWIAWFTPQIPISLGLGSKNGLPGLVLELEDESGRYYKKIKSIEPTDDTFDAEWAAYQNTIKGIDEVYSLQRSMEEQEAYREAVWDEFKRSKNIKSKTTKVNIGPEMVYEWENEQEKEKYLSLNK